jgi:hypothetical protein
LQALGEHGDESGAVPRDRVIQAYRLFMGERNPMAAFVAGDLAEWEYWDAVAEYAELLISNVCLDAASRGAIVAYLERCPRPEAKAALASLPVAPVNPPLTETSHPFGLPTGKSLRR